MNKYIGNNIEVQAEPMTLGEAVEKGFVVCIDNKQLSEEQAHKIGYLVEHTDGFYQWLDKETFDNHYAKADSSIDQLYVERKQLADKFQKLCLFIDKDFEDKVKDLEERKLLKAQQHYMDEYLNVLNQRLKKYANNK